MAARGGGSRSCGAPNPQDGETPRRGVCRGVPRFRLVNIAESGKSRATAKLTVQAETSKAKRCRSRRGTRADRAFERVDDQAEVAADVGGVVSAQIVVNDGPGSQTS